MGKAKDVSNYRRRRKQNLIVVVFKRIFFGDPVSGYATIVGLILLLGGIQLFCIGIIGSYLAKTYVQSKNRPIYIAKEILKR